MDGNEGPHGERVNVIQPFLILPRIFLLAGCAAPSGGIHGSGGAGTDNPSVTVARDPADIEQVAILPFKASTTLIGSSVPDMFVTEVLKINRYDLVERAQMSGVPGETEVGLPGLSPYPVAAPLPPGIEPMPTETEPGCWRERIWLFSSSPPSTSTSTVEASTRS